MDLYRISLDQCCGPLPWNPLGCLVHCTPWLDYLYAEWKDGSVPSPPWWWLNTLLFCGCPQVYYLKPFSLNWAMYRWWVLLTHMKLATDDVAYSRYISIGRGSELYLIWLAEWCYNDTVVHSVCAVGDAERALLIKCQWSDVRDYPNSAMMCTQMTRLMARIIRIS